MRNLRSTLTLIGLALLLAACSDPRLEPLFDDDVILAFGDSLTEGVGVDAEQSYPAALERLSGRTVVNAGIAGETTTEGLQRLPQVLDRTRPNLMILLEGGNDILRNHDPAVTEANLERMIEMARERGIEVLLVGVPEKKLFSDTAPLYGDLARRYDLPFEDDAVADLLRNPEVKSDAVHFNADGYRRLAEAVYGQLQAEGAL
ncbi:arylesterase [Marinobacter bohaiensis]|uniref:arylesterase n=1 Tax=Marinobacter bohaiensis TaxID=2201898 RepID=UPI000DACE7FD|nr:arylesterase [Marinobacter bohaiensis]